VRVLVVNAGSSSLKLTLLACGGERGEDGESGEDGTRKIAERELDAPRAEVDAGELRAALDSPLGEADAVGHRIVHGGEHYREAVRVDAKVERDLRELTDLAPLHQPKSLAALDAVSAALPHVPAVACFDTAFHATMGAAATTYALPAEWRERWGLRRYGFHGLSHAWVARRAPQLLGADDAGDVGDANGAEGVDDDDGVARARSAGLRIVSCHLGAGASLCAIADGRSVDTTMGFTPLEGLAMATRSGSVDPGLVLWLLEHEQLSAEKLADALEHRSGMLGLAGSTDMRDVVARARRDDPSACLALDVYVHRLRAGIAAMAASLGGMDALVFTGGVGERSSEVRARAAAGLGFLGVALDEARNREADGDGPVDDPAGDRRDAWTRDRRIGAEDAAVCTLTIAAREDLEIARQVRAVLENGPPGAGTRGSETAERGTGGRSAA
jgi:acetate kinase